MNYGYIRVSTRDQNEERQRLAMGELEIPENTGTTSPARTLTGPSTGNWCGG